LVQSSARFGLAARAAVYLLVGSVAMLVAFGRTHTETDQTGALRELNRQTYGHALLWLLAIGLASYALWRFSEAWLGAAGQGKRAGARIHSAAGGLVYAVFAVSAFRVALGGRAKSQAKNESGITASVMGHTGGRIAVGIAGTVVLVIGLAFVYQGVRKKFRLDLDLNEVSQRVRRTVETLGVAGTAARGLAFALAGVFTIQAAINYNPDKARGLDEALRSLRDTTAGPGLLVIEALGLIAFGLYGCAEVRWHKV
jgi:hypothetical protein